MADGRDEAMDSGVREIGRSGGERGGAGVQRDGWGKDVIDQPAVADFARWVESRRKECRPYLYRRPGLVREVAEGLLLWLAFQL